jgi:hypothetical protein
MARRADVRLPRARKPEDLIIEQVADDVLVYDFTNQKAHCLNKAAALVWRHCDGATPVATALRALAEAGLPSEPAVVELAIEDLSKAKLVEPVADWSNVHFRSRRTVLKQLGLVAAVAVVQSIVAPSVAQATSCAGNTCMGNGDCTCMSSMCSCGGCMGGQNTGVCN